MAAKLSALQLVFALTWVVYVIYLPALAAQAGIDKRYVPWILMMDQAIFIACDWAAGIYADRAAKAMKRVGEPMALAALASCAAFLALPFVAPMGGATLFLALTAFWSATSSALRAPTLALVSRHLPDSASSWIAAVFLLGVGLASALAPYLALALKGVDPRIPFAAVSIILVSFVLLLARAERGYQPKPAAAADLDHKPSTGGLVAFGLAALLLAVGFQIHFSINSAPAWLRVAAADQLPWLMPIFWVGFNLAVLPAAWLPRRHGATKVMAIAAGIGLIAMALTAQATSLEMLAAAQLVAGGAWAVVLNSAFTAALETGRVGKEGLATGVLFSILAAAALARLAVTSAGFQSGVGFVPVFAWAAAAAIMLGIMMGRLPPASHRRA